MHICTRSLLVLEYSENQGMDTMYCRLMRTVQFTVPHNTYPPNLRYQYYWCKFLTFDRYTSIIIFKYIYIVHTITPARKYIYTLKIFVYMHICIHIIGVDYLYLIYHILYTVPYLRIQILLTTMPRSTTPTSTIKMIMATSRFSR